MAKLIDDVSQMLNPTSKEKFSRIFERGACFDIANVSNYFWSHQQRGWDNWTEGYPTIAPVFEDAWFEGRRPLVGEVENTEKLKREGIPHRWAVCMSGGKDMSYDLSSFKKANQERRKNISEEIDRWLRVNADLPNDTVFPWFMVVTFWIQLEKHLPIQTAKTVLYAVDRQGQMCGKPTCGGYYNKDLMCWDQSEWQEEADLLRPALFALSLLHCKNVARIEHVPDVKLQKARQRKNKPPLTSYYTLEIEPMRKVLQTEGQVETVGLKKALHICRGHFANYSPERPLFGRVSGKFWIPAHTRGTKEVGEVIKDYAIKAPTQAQ